MVGDKAPGLEHALPWFIGAFGITAVQALISSLVVYHQFASSLGAGTVVVVFAPPVPGVNYGQYVFPGPLFRTPYPLLEYAVPIVLELVGFFVLLRGWILWRDAVHATPDLAPDVGRPSSASSVKSAVRDYRLATGSFVGLLLTNSLLARLWFVIAVVPPSSLSNPGGLPTVVPFWGVPLLAEILLVYFFATRSWSAMSSWVPPRESNAGSSASRAIVLAGGFASGLPLLEPYYFPAILLMPLGPAIVALGLLSYRRRLPHRGSP